MQRVEYLKEKWRIIKALVFSHNYIIITEDEIAAHVCTDDAMVNMKQQIVLAGYQLERSGQERAARIVRE